VRNTTTSNTGAAAIGSADLKDNEVSALDNLAAAHDGNNATLAINDNWKDTDQAAIQATGIPS
jgi:hypothetical protein